MAVPLPRPPADHHEHVEPCRRHHRHMVNCPDCCAWHRHLLDAQRDQADRRQARREATA